MLYNNKKNNGGEHSEGGVDDWLMTYADMITLLLCFFAIILSMSEPKKSEIEKARQQIIEQFDTGKPKTPEQLAKEKKESAEEPEELIGGFNKKPPPEEEEGERITTMEMSSASFFASGSAVLSEDGKFILRDLVDKLLSGEYAGYTVTVEGHTDDVPINTVQFPSNWELSTARAASVVRHFIDRGIPRSQLRASGYADSFPKVSNRDEYGNPIPSNQAENRRVVIKLEKVTKKKEVQRPLLGKESLF